MKRRHSNDSPPSQSNIELINNNNILFNNQQQTTNNEEKLIQKFRFPQTNNLSNFSLPPNLFSPQFLPQQLNSVFNGFQSPKKSSNTEIPLEERRAQEEALQKLGSLLFGYNSDSNININLNEEENEQNPNGNNNLFELFTLLLSQQQQQSTTTTINENSEETLNNLIGQLFNQTENNRNLKTTNNGFENDNLEENNLKSNENTNWQKSENLIEKDERPQTSKEQLLINGNNNQNKKSSNKFVNNQQSSEAPLDLSNTNLNNNLILRPRPRSNCSFHSSASSLSNTPATAPPSQIFNSTTEQPSFKTSQSDCPSTMFMSLQSQNQQNLLTSFPPHHHIFDGIPPPTTTTTNAFLHPAAAWLCGLPPPSLNNSLPPHCSPSSPKSPSHLINNIATSTQQNFFSSMCHPQSSQSLADEDDDWEQMMEISCTDEAEKIRELAGENAQPPTDPNQCIICRRVLSCKSALQMHYRTHTGERPFKCRICQRAFTTKGNLKTHMGVHKSKAPLRQHIFALGSNSDSPERCHSSNENLINSDLFSNSGNLNQRFSMEEGSQPLNNLNRSFPLPSSILFSSSSSTIVGRNNLIYGSSLPPHSIGSLPQHFPPPFPPTFMPNFPPINGIPPPFQLSMADSSQAALAAQLQLFLSSNPQFQLNENNSSAIDHGLALSNLFLPPKDEQKMEEENEKMKNEGKDEDGLEENEREGKDKIEEETSSSIYYSSPNRKMINEKNNEENNNLGLPAFFIQKLAAAAKFKIDEQFMSSSSNVKNSYKEEDDQEEEGGKTKKKKKRMNNDGIEELEVEKFSKIIDGNEEEKKKDEEEDEDNKERIGSSTSPSMLESVPQTSFSSSTSIKVKEEIKKEKEEDPLENLQRIFSAADSPPPHPPSSSAMPPSSACFLLAPIQKPPNAKHHCRWCMKGFSSSSALQIHTRTHTGDRPYKCEICERAFTTRGNLKVHKEGTHSLPQNPSRRGRRIFDMEETILGTIRQQQQPPSLLFSQSPPLASNFDEQQRQQQAAAAIANLLANVVGNNNSFGLLNEIATTSNASIPSLINNFSANVSETPSASNQLPSTTASPLSLATNASTFAAAAAAQLAALGNNDGQQMLMNLLFQHLQNVEMAERIEEEEEREEEENGEELKEREDSVENKKANSIRNNNVEETSVIRENKLNNERIEEYLKENIKKKNHSSENNIIVPVHNTTIL